LATACYPFTAANELQQWFNVRACVWQMSFTVAKGMFYDGKFRLDFMMDTFLKANRFYYGKISVGLYDGYFSKSKSNASAQQNLSSAHVFHHLQQSAA